MMYTLLNGQVAHSVKAAKNADTVPESTGIYGVCTAADLTAALRSFLLANLEPPFQSLLPPRALPPHTACVPFNTAMTIA